MKHGSAEAIDRSRVSPAEGRDPRGVVGVRLRDDVQQRGPAAAQPEDLVTVVIEQAPDERLDGGIEAGNITAAGEDGDSFHRFRRAFAAFSPSGKKTTFSASCRSKRATPS